MARMATQVLLPWKAPTHVWICLNYPESPSYKLLFLNLLNFSFNKLQVFFTLAHPEIVFYGVAGVEVPKAQVNSNCWWQFWTMYPAAPQLTLTWTHVYNPHPAYIHVCVLFRMNCNEYHWKVSSIFGLRLTVENNTFFWGLISSMEHSRFLEYGALHPCNY